MSKSICQSFRLQTKQKIRQQDLKPEKNTVLTKSFMRCKLFNSKIRLSPLRYYNWPLEKCYGDIYFFVIFQE